MKQLLTFVLCLLTTIPSFAQNFDKQWKKIEQAMNDDQPRTVVIESQRLYEMADQNNNLPQMLRAFLTYMQYREELSPDSFAIDKAKLVQWQQQTQDIVDRSLLSFVLAVNETDDEQSYRLFCQSLGVNLLDEDIIVAELAQKKTSDYIPLLKLGADSEVFHHDMLSFLRMMTRDNVPYRLRDKLIPHIYQRDELFYKGNGQIDAAVKVALEGWENGSSSYKSLDEMILQYGNVDDLVVQRAIELSPDNKEKETLEELRVLISRYPKHRLIGRVYDKIGQIIQPYLYTHAISRSFYPGEMLDWKMDSKNVQQVEMRWYKLPNLPNLPTTYLTADDRDLKNLKKSGRLENSRSFSLTDKSFVSRTDTLQITAPNVVGYYLIEMLPTHCDEYPTEKAESELCLVNVTRLMPYVVPVNEKQVEIWALDRQSGHPVEDTQVQVLNREDDTFTTLSQGVTSKDGYAEMEQWNKGQYLLLTKGQDRTLMQLSRRYYRGYKPSNRKEQTKRLFTDRSLYRPGQTVQFSLMVYAQSGDDVHVAPGQELTVQLFEPFSYKALNEVTVKTDDFGVAAGLFVLPESGKSGEYSLGVKNGSRTYFRVEEYKRPTFEVVWQPIEGEYAFGDTITVSGRAMTYAGVPVSMAQVNVKKSFRLMRWWNLQAQNHIATDTLYTDNEGRFSAQMVLRLPDSQDKDWGMMGCFARFVLDATITSSAGESHEAQQLVTVSRNRFNLSLNYSDKECKENPSKWVVNLCNSAGQPMEQMVNLSIRSKVSDGVVWESEIIPNKDFAIDALPALPSGNYVISLGVDTLKIDYPFKLFSLTDKSPVEETPLWVYADSHKMKVGEPLRVQYGTSMKDAFIQLNIYNSQGRISHVEHVLSNELHLLKTPCQEIWGDAIKLVFSIVRDGQVYQQEVHYELAAPDKELQAEWTSFRDYLLPGQQETWTLKITQKGKPVSANLMATMYDASLDAINPNHWGFHLNFPRSSSSFVPYHTANQFGYSVQFDGLYNNKGWRFPEFDRWADNLNLRIGGHYRLFNGGRVMTRMAAKNMMVESAAMALDEAVVTEGNANAKAVAEEEPKMEMRSNFQETAFFLPMLRTNKDGMVAIQFTLPESLTRWKMMGFAHTKQLDYALIENQTTARKLMMVQPQLPRFLRVGDNATLVATVQNLSDEAIKGTLYLELSDSTLNTVVLKKNMTFEIPANSSKALSFSYQVKDLGPSIVCKFYAKAGDFTDGEQHLLPLLSDKVWLTESRAVYLNDEKQKIDLSGMMHGGEWWNSSSSMTVESIHNPLWVAVESLETLRKPCTNNAVDLASAYYATAIGKMLVDNYPSLAQQKGFQIEESAAETWLKQLQELQCADGGFSWFKGMHSSTYITRMVVEPFVRLHVLGVPYLDKNRYEVLIGKALAYLDAQAIESYRQMQKWEKENKNKEKLALSENVLHYLYFYSLLPHGLGKEGREALSFFMDRLPLGLNSKNLYDKALACIVFAKNGKTKDASKQMQSLLEYTVYSDELGRYYDTRRSMVSWRNYRMPVQTLLMEALGLMVEDNLKVEPEKPAMNRNQIRKELTQWLLNQRRTQLWENSSTVMDALYALLLAPKSDLAVTNTDKMYVKSEISSQLSPKMPKEWVVRRDPESSDSPMSWVSVSMKTLVPLDVVQPDNAHTGLKVRRQFFVESVEDGRLQYKPANLSELKVGDKLISRVLLSADRDFDFVEIHSKRASCMEPVRQLSGYIWYGRIGSYYSAKDSESVFYIDRLPKGEYELSEDLFITHQGTYQVGLTEAAGVYCPEFSDHTESMTVTVKE